MKTLYTAHATVIAGRNGQADTSDNQLSVKLAKPSGDKTGTNPEQLFACGYGACFGSAVEAVAKAENVTTGEIKVQADVSLNQDDKGGYFISAALNVTIADVDKATAEHLVQKAHHVCPYSKATRGNIEVELKVNNEPLKAAA